MNRAVYLSVFGFAGAFALLQTETCSTLDAQLSVLELRVGHPEGEDRIEGFVPSGIYYKANLPPQPETAVLVVESKDPTATIEVTHDGEPLPLQNGTADVRAPFQGSRLEIRVSLPDGDRLSYQVDIDRGHSYEALSQFVDDYVAANLRPFDVAGLAVLVMGPQGRVLERVYGLANLLEAAYIAANTPFNLASLSKQFTATAAMILYEEGRLDPSDLITDTFPEAPAEWVPITVHHLLSHQSGIPDFHNDAPGGIKDWTNDEVLAWAVSQPLEFPPGGRYEYSNTGFALVAMLVERISGEPFPSFMQERIFTPLGMVDSSVPSEWPPDIPDRARSYLQSLLADRPLRAMGEGNQYTSLRDLEIWEYAVRDAVLVSRETLNLMHTPHAFMGPGCGYGYGWVICNFGGPTYLEHNGSSSGFRTASRIVVEDGLAVFMLSNGSFTWTHQLANDLALFYRGFGGAAAKALGPPHVPGDPI